MEKISSQWGGRRLLEKDSIRGLDLLRILFLVEEEADSGKYALRYPEETTSIALLMAHTQYLHKSLGVTEEECAKEGQRDIELLHKYNRAKDAAQELMGILAGRKGLTLKEMHEMYDLPVEG